MIVPVLIVIVVLVAALAIGQIALPRIAESRIRSRLTEGGGQASVSVEARPALRLLRNGGDRLRVRGHGLRIGLAGEEAPGGNRRRPSGLSALDGFYEVDIELVDFRTGPLDVRAFVLARAGGGSYAMAAEGSITGGELLRFGDPWLRSAIPGGGLIGAVAGGAPLTSRSVAVSIEIELLSGPGGLEVGSGGGSIAGYPAGPLATAVAAAVARRLEIVP